MALVFSRDPLAPVQCAVEIARAVHEHAGIHLRMGVHSGPVSRMTDLTGRENVTGSGINTAQRVMSCGDAGHILISSASAEVICEFDSWTSCVHDLGAIEAKHGQRIHLYNLLVGEVGNPSPPSALTTSNGPGDEKPIPNRTPLKFRSAPPPPHNSTLPIRAESRLALWAAASAGILAIVAVGSMIVFHVIRGPVNRKPAAPTPSSSPKSTTQPTTAATGPIVSVLPGIDVRPGATFTLRAQAETGNITVYIGSIAVPSKSVSGAVKVYLPRGLPAGFYPVSIATSADSKPIPAGAVNVIASADTASGRPATSPAGDDIPIAGVIHPETDDARSPRAETAMTMPDVGKNGTGTSVIHPETKGAANALVNNAGKSEADPSQIGTTTPIGRLGQAAYDDLLHDNYAQAVTFTDAFLAREPGSDAGYAYLAYAYAKQGNAAAAQTAVQQARQVADSGNSRVQALTLIASGAVEENAGDPTAAMTAFESAIKIDKSLGLAYLAYSEYWVDPKFQAMPDREKILLQRGVKAADGKEDRDALQAKLNSLP